MDQWNVETPEEGVEREGDYVQCFRLGMGKYGRALRFFHISTLPLINFRAFERNAIMVLDSVHVKSDNPLYPTLRLLGQELSKTLPP